MIALVVAVCGLSAGYVVLPVVWLLNERHARNTLPGHDPAPSSPEPQATRRPAAKGRTVVHADRVIDPAAKRVTNQYGQVVSRRRAAELADGQGGNT